VILISCLPLSILGDSHSKKNNCPEDNIATLYDLIYGNYLPFDPPLDEEGNISLSPEELFVMKSKHFFNQIKKVDPVKISLATYASLLKEVHLGPAFIILMDQKKMFLDFRLKY